MSHRTVNKLARANIKNKTKLTGDILTDSLNGVPHFQLIITAASGYGKSCIVKHLINTLEYDQLLIMGAECDDNGEYGDMSLVNRSSTYDEQRLEDMRVRDGYKKLVIFDDVSGLRLRQASKKNYLDEFSSNARHYGINIISSVQTLIQIPKAFSTNCTHAMIARLYPATLELTMMITGEKTKTLRLEDHAFLFIGPGGLEEQVKMCIND